MSAFAFYALGTPGPQGSKIRTKFAMRESSPLVAPWREAVKAAAPTIERALDGPLAVRVVFTVARPKSAKKTALRPFSAPDIDKLTRSTFDGITQAGLWADDARVCEVTRLAKVWTGYDPDALPVPGVVVACCEIVDLFDAQIRDHLWGLSHDVRNAAFARVRGVA